MKHKPKATTKKCKCGCGRDVPKGMKSYATPACQRKATKARDVAKRKRVKWQKSRGITEKKLDDKCRELARLKYNNVCAKCGRMPKLKDDGTIKKHHDWHHIFTRRRKSTKWYLPNHILLCSYCHKQDPKESAHEAPKEFELWLLKNHMTEKEYDELRLLSNQRNTKSLEEWYEYLLVEEKKLKGEL